MATAAAVIITDDLYNELENYLIPALDEGDGAALEVLLSYARSLASAADSLEDSEEISRARELLRSALDWSAEALPDSSEGIPEELEEDFEGEFVANVEEATQILGDLLIPLGPDGYAPGLRLGRLSLDQISAYDPSGARVELAGVSYGFGFIPESAR